MPLSPARRTEIARQKIAARWARREPANEVAALVKECGGIVAVAAALGVSRFTINKWCNAGLIPFYMHDRVQALVPGRDIVHLLTEPRTDFNGRKPKEANHAEAQED